MLPPAGAPGVRQALPPQMRLTAAPKPGRQRWWQIELLMAAMVRLHHHAADAVPQWEASTPGAVEGEARKAAVSSGTAQGDPLLMTAAGLLPSQFCPRLPPQNSRLLGCFVVFKNLQCCRK